ncbi:MAG: PaaI family thioesterase [Methanomicrobiales archaeon]|nr:PaaI family thioesterase [Methanomicrobiales archaeon]
MSSPASGVAGDFFQCDRVGEYLGVELLSLSPDRTTVRMEIQDRHLNLFGTVHGGVIFSLADIAFGLAGNAEGISTVAIDATISYLKSARSGTLHAEARRFSSQGRLSSYQVIVTDQNGEEIALFMGMAYQKSSPPLLLRE